MDNEITFAELEKQLEFSNAVIAELRDDRTKLQEQVARLTDLLRREKADLLEEMELRAKDVRQLKKDIARQEACRRVTERDLREIIAFKEKEIIGKMEQISNLKNESQKSA